MDIADRSRHRRATMKSHRAESFEDAERWDLQFWQEQTPQDRLAALLAIRRDIRKVRGGEIRE